MKLANHGFRFFRELDPCASFSTTPRFAFGFRLGDAANCRSLRTSVSYAATEAKTPAINRPAGVDTSKPP
ncbi:MAG: hypothetical protein ACK5TO_11735, partial [Planctomycetaceae bacterium]